MLKQTLLIPIKWYSESMMNELTPTNKPTSFWHFFDDQGIRYALLGQIFSAIFLITGFVFAFYLASRCDSGVIACKSESITSFLTVTVFTLSCIGANLFSGVIFLIRVYERFTGYEIGSSVIIKQIIVVLALLCFPVNQLVLFAIYKFLF